MTAPSFRALTSAYPILGGPHPPTADTTVPTEPATITRAAVALTAARTGTRLDRERTFAVRTDRRRRKGKP